MTETKNEEPAIVNSSENDYVGMKKRKLPDVTKPTDTASLVDALTFANKCCGCDECANDMLSCSDNSRLVSILKKSPIEEAISSHNRGFSVSGKIARTQKREYITREEHIPTGVVVSLYKYTLPIGATPLFEFGDSMRFLYVVSKHDNVALCEVNDGIDTKLKCKSGDVFCVKPNLGKTLGWRCEIMLNHETSPNTATNSETIVYMFKLSGDVKKIYKDDGKPHLWSDRIVDIAKKIDTAEGHIWLKRIEVDQVKAILCELKSLENT